MRTPISYYGGKQAMPQHEVYTEVFFGGGTLFFAKDPVKNETINDKLDIVINFYQVLKNNFRQLKKLIDAILFSRTLHRKALYIIKNKHKHTPVDLAWAFWMCSNFSYSNKIGGGFKYSNECFTVPSDSMTNRKKEFTEILVQRIEHVHIENEDAVKILLSRNVEKAFHYIDPPYPGADQGHYKGYTFDDLSMLLETCEKIRGKFLLSNYNSEILDSFIIKNGWHKKEITHRIQAPRKSGTKKVEVLVYNYTPGLKEQQKLNFELCM